MYNGLAVGSVNIKNRSCIVGSDSKEPKFKVGDIVCDEDLQKRGEVLEIVRDNNGKKQFVIKMEGSRFPVFLPESAIELYDWRKNISLGEKVYMDNHLWKVTQISSAGDVSLERVAKTGFINPSDLEFFHIRSYYEGD